MARRRCRALMPRCTLMSMSTPCPICTATVVCTLTESLSLIHQRAIHCARVVRMECAFNRNRIDHVCIIIEYLALIRKHFTF